ncbi:MAG: phenylalanine--tRNA ligase subunit beta [Bacteroidia bacterium]|nr:MAG: phenylalanine--tRNA ligase subunit beta [Bacteroidia bacterium]
MKISYNWLKEYIDYPGSPEELAVLLTDSGLEVESLDRFESIRGGLKGVVIGEVISCHPHPNADKLTLTLVDVGGGDNPLPIVCGAPNVAEGQKVLVALTGATLYTPQGEFSIKKTKIRGEVSEGMICAEDELGLGSSHDGIMVLPDQAPTGMSAADYFNVARDWVYEIGLTPNRIDAASHIGVARDVMAVVNHQKKKKEVNIRMPDISSFVADNNDLPIPVFVEDPDACPRYSSLTIKGLRVSESPDWLKNRLQSIGLKPINNVVDITNFVLHELGQPLHAFDADAIDGGKVVVKKSPPGTIFETLDKEKLELTGNDLMICNDSTPMCMGGILGGIESGVTENTSRIFLESACFDPLTIRRSSKHHGIKTDASFRFERGSDPNMTIYALKRAALMIKEVAGGQISSNVHDVYPIKKKPVELELGFSRVQTLIGKKIPADEVLGILEDLDFSILESKKESVKLAVPLYRVDVTRDADVVEEILRIYGYNNVDIPSKMHSSIVISPKPDKESLQNIVSDMLAARGFTEIMNNSLTKGAYYENMGFDPEASVVIQNPLSQDLNVMRQTLLFGGLETIAYNQNRKVQNMKLYEFGNIYLKKRMQERENPLDAYSERMVLAFFLTGKRQPESWSEPEQSISFFDLKNAAYAILQRLGIDPEMLRVEEVSGNDRFAYGMDVYVEKTHLARLGLLSKKLLGSMDVKDKVFYGMIEWEALIAVSAEQSLTYRDVPRFPEVRRDLALLIDKKISFVEIENIARQTEKRILKEVNLFDVYEDEAKLGKQKKSYAVSFTFQDNNKTLTDKEIDKIMDKLTRSYEKTLGAVIR